MSQPISLFSGYSQSENRTTNYCLLLLKMLYEENPKYLAEVMNGLLLDEDFGKDIGVHFRQQEHKVSSVPDGHILQSAFTIYIETKSCNWFHDKQLENHLAALDKEHTGRKVLLALSNFESDTPPGFTRIRQLCDDKYKGSIIFDTVSFEDFINALKLKHLPKNLADTVDEFRKYLDEQDLLPSWKRRLDVVNCARRPDDVLVERVYICPATAGAYTHDRCKYFGMYRKRHIEQVALIEAVVDVEAVGNATVKWQNEQLTKEGELKKLAQEKIQKLQPDDFPKRVFLLGPLYGTNCFKDSTGGMQNSKLYFNVGPLEVKDAEHLAQALSGKTWSEIRALSGS